MVGLVCSIVDIWFSSCGITGLGTARIVTPGSLRVHAEIKIVINKITIIKKLNVDKELFMRIDILAKNCFHTNLPMIYFCADIDESYYSDHHTAEQTPAARQVLVRSEPFWFAPSCLCDYLLIPVDPWPPSPLSVSFNFSTSFHIIVVKVDTTNCAIRSPFEIINFPKSGRQYKATYNSPR